MVDIIGDSMVIVFSIIRVIIGLIILNRAKNAKLLNLTILGIVFILEGIAYVFYTSILNYIFLFHLILSLSVIFLIFFTEKTFYEDRKSPFLVILIINIVLLVISTITSGIIQFLASSDIIIIGITRICIASQIMTIGGWQFMAAFNALKEFKSNEIVEPWVKVRYYLIIIYSACDFGGGATFIFLPLDKSVDIVFILASIFILILIAAQFLAWIMPRPLKKWLNRNYKTPEDGKELSEEQIISGFGE